MDFLKTTWMFGELQRAPGGTYLTPQTPAYRFTTWGNIYPCKSGINLSGRIVNKERLITNGLLNIRTWKPITFRKAVRRERAREKGEEHWTRSRQGNEELDNCFSYTPPPSASHSIPQADSSYLVITIATIRLPLTEFKLPLPIPLRLIPRNINNS